MTLLAQSHTYLVKAVPPYMAKTIMVLKLCIVLGACVSIAFALTLSYISSPTVLKLWLNHELTDSSISSTF